MNLNYTTQIDTVAIQINCVDDSFMQRDVVAGLIEFLQIHFNSYIATERHSVGAVDKVEHKLYCNNRIVFVIQTGFSHGVFFVKIRFAGLATYDSVVDNTSINYLWAVVAYINTNKLLFNLSELDIAIDVSNVEFDQLLPICTSKTSGTLYFGLQEQQRYSNETHYVEKFKNKSEMDMATKRAYLYDKTLKEWNEHKNDIGYQVNRFEVKLQANFFNRYGLDIVAIESALNKYHFLYFDFILDKYDAIDRYNSYARFTNREIERMGLDQYRLYPDMVYINSFLSILHYATLDDLYSPYGAKQSL